MIGKEGIGGIQDLTFMSIQKCPIDIRSDLFQNIVLSGTSSSFGRRSWLPCALAG